MENVNEVYVEKVHSRKSKTNFKGVIQKMLISSLVLTSVLGTSSAAFAAENDRVDMPKMDMSAVKVVAYENGISVETALSQIRTTVAKLKIQVQQGNVQKASLESLASQLNQLEKSANGKSSTQIVSTLNNVESAVKGVSGNEQVMVALQSVRDSLGISSVTDTAQAPKTNAEGVDFADKDKIPSWALGSIQEMSKIGLINGKPVNVDGQVSYNFDAQGIMTRAEYVNIAVKAAYQEELASMTPSNPWYENAFTVAFKHGILNGEDPDFMDNPTEGIRREEMALILIRTAHAKGIATTDWVYQTQIPDFKEVSPYYRDSVRECYTLGMLNGVDQIGTFNPQGTLDRASASQSFYKLLNADKRTPVTPQKPAYNQTGEYKPADTLQTFKEGEPHSIPQAGDTVIAKDGRTVVLEEVDLGNGTKILGWGQGVDIVTGTTINGIAVGKNHWNDQSKFVKSPFNNEVYSATQWDLISKATYPKGLIGDYDGEVYNTYWVWDGATSMWLWTVDD